MRVPRIYLETSVFNFCFADDAPDKKNDTLKLFEEIKAGLYVPYTSAYVMQELVRAVEPKQSQMVALIAEYEMRFLEQSDAIRDLAELYVVEGIIPAKHLTDALHIAAATVHDLDIIVSYNFRHIVKRKTVTMAEVVNLREGYKRIGIFSPTEVIENDE
jgi:predicted nucleic acid-binding protein